MLPAQAFDVYQRNCSGTCFAEVKQLTYAFGKTPPCTGLTRQTFCHGRGEPFYDSLDHGCGCECDVNETAPSATAPASSSSFGATTSLARPVSSAAQTAPTQPSTASDPTTVTALLPSDTTSLHSTLGKMSTVGVAMLPTVTVSAATTAATTAAAPADDSQSTVYTQQAQYNATTTAAEPHESLPSVAIAVGAAGGGMLLLCVGCLVVCHCRAKRISAGDGDLIAMRKLDLVCAPERENSGTALLEELGRADADNADNTHAHSHSQPANKMDAAAVFKGVFDQIDAVNTTTPTAGVRLADQTRVVPRSILLAHVALGKEIGSGSFGKVHKATLDEGIVHGGFRLPAYTVAVKTCDNPKAVDEMWLEGGLMAQVPPHSNIVGLVGVVMEADAKFLVMAYCTDILRSL